MKIINKTENTTIADNATLADSFGSRMVGLLRHSTLNSGEGLIITKCNSIHMFFMKFPIDVIFLDKNNIVVGLVENILPNRLSRIYWKATTAIEVPVGVISASKTTLNNSIIIE